MKKSILNLSGTKKLTTETLKEIKGGFFFEPVCGGDGSYIYQNGAKVCCYVPPVDNCTPKPGHYCPDVIGQGTYIC
ncbi:hypothetical protein [Tenacibaculum xiamenense]|uniref:hypothetical protein n=1 Tax=Tenacibaculum xiamenense TaxID=1261553 RepID=UPI003894226C